MTAGSVVRPSVKPSKSTVVLEAIVPPMVAPGGLSPALVAWKTKKDVLVSTAEMVTVVVPFALEVVEPVCTLTVGL